MVQSQSPPEREHPYRTPSPPPKKRQKFVDRIGRSKLATGVVGALTLLLWLVAIAIALEAPGMLIVCAMCAKQSRPLPNNSDLLMLAPMFTVVGVFITFVAYKFGRALCEIALEVGTGLVKKYGTQEEGEP